MQPATPHVQLEPWTDNDLDLLRRLNSPEMTAHLGGPETDDQVVNRHNRYLAGSDPVRSQMFSVVLLPERVAVGSIGYWERDWRDESVYETGWMTLSEYQGRGIATAATAAAIESARARHAHRYMHAFPSVDNPPSNAICRKLGFNCLGEYDFEYPPGNILRCNDWRLDLSETR